MRWLDVRRLALCLAFVGCSPPRDLAGPTSTPLTSIELVVPDGAATPTPASVESAAVVGPAPRTPAFSPVRLWRGRHGAPIVAVEVADDGAGAVSLDEVGNARLWPALDGSREPLVLPVATPAEVAVHHDVRGFSVAVLDIVGGLDILAIDDAGTLTAQVRVQSDPSYASVIATPKGYLALRTDQRIEWIDRTGVRRGAVAPPFGERVARILGADGKVLVVFECRGSGDHEADWLELAPGGLAWRGETKELSVEPQWTFMSPDASRLVSLVGNPNVGGRPVLVDLAAGKTTMFQDPISLTAPQGRPLGFLDAETVAFSEPDASSVAWYRLDAKRLVPRNDTTSRLLEASGTVFAGGKGVSSSGRALVVVTPTMLRYLDHRRDDARSLRTTAGGVVATIGEPALLDGELRIERALPDGAIPVTRDLALVPLGLAQDDHEVHRRPFQAHRLALYDLEAHRELQAWPLDSARSRVRFEPATKLAVIDELSKLRVLRFDPKTRRFGEARPIEVPTTTDLVLLDPALAGGDVAITLHGRELRRWSAMNLDSATVPAATPIERAPETIDRAGRQYMREDGTVVVATRDSTRRLDALDGWGFRPSPDARRIAAFGFQRVKMLDQRGRELWSRALPGVTDLAWTNGNALVVQAGDLVRLRANDGSIETAQCGWAFAARADRPDESEGSERTFCDR